MIVHSFDRKESTAIVAFGRRVRDRFGGAFGGWWRWSRRILTPGRRAFFRLLSLQRVHHIFLLLASSRALRHKCLSVDIMVCLVYKWSFFAVFDAGFWFSCPIAVGWMEKSEETTFLTADLGRGF